MRKFLSILILFFFTGITVQAQTKVFKEVSDEISSQIRIIKQGDALVGYAVFTQLEKAKDDSFNYRITIMDENLNDIGVVNFREQQLSLDEIAFENDIICLAYLKSDVIGKTYKTFKAFTEARDNAKNAVFIQFVDLTGKIVKTNSYPVKMDLTQYPAAGKIGASGSLKHTLRLHNVPGHGFSCFYGDIDENNLWVFNSMGERSWHRAWGETAQFFTMQSTENLVLLLAKKSGTMDEGGFELLSYGVKDSVAYPQYILKDKKGNSLKVLDFGTDPNSGKPYLSGHIIDAVKGNDYTTPKHISKGPYSGVFTINIDGPKKENIKPVYSYWNDGSQSFVSARGYYKEQKAYARFSRSFRDYDGNTYFGGPTVVKKPKWGAIAATVVTAPLIMPSIMILAMTGTTKGKINDEVLVKQNAKGQLVLDNVIPANASKYYRGIVPISYYDNRTAYTVYNPDTKTGYLVLDDQKDIIIYNVNQKKVMRKISHKDGKTRVNVFPAKEGHVMVSEYNKKEKYTRVAIESL